MTLNDTWGFKSYDHNWKSTETLIRNLVDIASKGGNYLLNVGPTSEGLIPAPSVERLQAVGKWMAVNGEAIYSSSASPFRRLPWGRCTQKTSSGLLSSGTTLYLHVFNWPSDGKLLVPGLKNSAQKAYLLTDPKKTPLPMQTDAAGLTLSLPPTAPDPISSTIVLRIKGAPVVESISICQDYDGSIILPAADAQVHGQEIKYESDHPHDNLGYWTNPEDWADWQFTVTRPGKFDVTAEVAALDRGSFTVSVGESQVEGASVVTGDYGKFRVAKIGTIEISAPGKASLSIRPIKTGWNPMNLRAVRLKPLK
jgi:alpha-L-fucosidase